MVESSALLKRRTPKGYRGFESLPHRFRAALAKERITGTDREAAYSLLPARASRLVPVQVSAPRLPSSSISFSLPARVERKCDDARHSQFGAASALPGIFFWISWWNCSTRIRSLPCPKRDRRRLKEQTNDDAWPEFSFAGEGIRNPRLGQEEPRARFTFPQLPSRRTRTGLPSLELNPEADALLCASNGWPGTPSNSLLPGRSSLSCELRRIPHHAADGDSSDPAAYGLLER